MADLSKIENTVGLWSLGDFKPQMPTVSGRDALVHRLCVRLQTPLGRFPWWPRFGTDLAAFLLTKTPASAVASAAELECLKDEQVRDVRAFVQFSTDRTRMRVQLEIFDADGPFKRTLSIEQAKLELIELDAA